MLEVVKERTDTNHLLKKGGVLSLTHFPDYFVCKFIVLQIKGNVEEHRIGLTSTDSSFSFSYAKMSFDCQNSNAYPYVKGNNQHKKHYYSTTIGQGFCQIFVRSWTFEVGPFEIRNVSQGEHDFSVCNFIICLLVPRDFLKLCRAVFPNLFCIAALLVNNISMAPLNAKIDLKVN